MKCSNPIGSLNAEPFAQRVKAVNQRIRQQSLSDVCGAEPAPDEQIRASHDALHRAHDMIAEAIGQGHHVRSVALVMLVEQPPEEQVGQFVERAITYASNAVELRTVLGGESEEVRALGLLAAQESAEDVFLRMLPGMCRHCAEGTVTALENNHPPRNSHAARARAADHERSIIEQFLGSLGLSARR